MHEQHCVSSTYFLYTFFLILRYVIMQIKSFDEIFKKGFLKY